MCPVRTSNNNRILAPNARQVDVAKRAIQEILPVQQQKTTDAFLVQGFEGVLYNRLYQGRKCTCQSSQKQINTRLGVDGKASQGMISELVSGVKFDVSAYGQHAKQLDPYDTVTSPEAPGNKHQGTFDNVANDPSQIPARIGGVPFGDNGPIDFDIHSLADDWDDGHIATTEVACTVCFGTSYVGGYSSLYGRRIVLAASEIDLPVGATLDVAKTPWSATCQAFSFVTVLPYQANFLDCIRVWNSNKMVAANFTVDGNAVNSRTILQYCDGKPHRINVDFVPQNGDDGIKEWTHIEIQFKTSHDRALFEFPRINKSGDMTLLDQTEPFQIILSPMIPLVQMEDVFTESTYGKTLIVSSVNTWNTRQVQTLGWECQVRVAQPQEIYNLLPRRGRVKTKPETSNMVHDNSTGYRRT